MVVDVEGTCVVVVFIVEGIVVVSVVVSKVVV